MLMRFLVSAVSSRWARSRLRVASWSRRASCADIVWHASRVLRDLWNVQNAGVRRRLVSGISIRREP